MIPLLAPLLGSLAGTMLPATVGSGVAASLGLAGTTAGGLVAAAAPKAIGAGIGTLLGGGDLDDAAVNAVGFGAAGALGGAGGAAANAAGAAAPATAAGTTGAAAAAPASAGLNLQQAAKTLQAVNSLTGAGAPRAAPAMPAPQPVQAPRQSAQNNPMLAQPVMAQQAPATPVTVPTAIPASVGIGSIPMGGQTPMSNNMMTAGMGTDQRNMVSDYLRSQGMVGFV